MAKTSLPQGRVARYAGQSRDYFHWRMVSCHFAELQCWKSVIINIWCTSGNEIEVMHDLGSWRVDGDDLTRRHPRPSRGESAHGQCNLSPMWGAWRLV